MTAVTANAQFGRKVNGTASRNRIA